VVEVEEGEEGNEVVEVEVDVEEVGNGRITDTADCSAIDVVVSRNQPVSSTEPCALLSFRLFTALHCTALELSRIVTNIIYMQSSS
jgi:hypothetical protein